LIRLEGEVAEGAW